MYEDDGSGMLFLPSPLRRALVQVNVAGLRHDETAVVLVGTAGSLRFDPTQHEDPQYNQNGPDSFGLAVVVRKDANNGRSYVGVHQFYIGAGI